MKLKKIFYIIIIGFLLCTITGCKNENTITEEEKETPKGNCEIAKCMNLLEPTNTIEEMNEIIGFSGELENSTGKYTWQLTKKNSITAVKSDRYFILQANMDKTKIANKKVDFSAYSELKDLLDQGQSFTYQELVKKLNGVEGTLAGKTFSSENYIWVDKNNQTLSATFPNSENGECSLISLQ